MGTVQYFFGPQVALGNLVVAQAESRHTAFMLIDKEMAGD
jgi:hypothetical protein